MNTDEEFESKQNSRSPMFYLKRERQRRGWAQSQLAERLGTTQANISRWEKGMTAPGPYYRQKLGELFGKSMQELGFISENDAEPAEEIINTSNTLDDHTPISPLPIWNIPSRRNPFFTGREEILLHLYTVLKGNKTQVLTNIQALSGLGGIGKTQIAGEYAYRYCSHYHAIFWVNASSYDVFSADFVMLAALLDLPEQHEQNQDIVIRAVKHWLTTHKQWLLILDNVDNLELIFDFLPIYSMGDVLITTRLQALGAVARQIEVEKMGLDEGITFLLRRTKILVPGTSLDHVSQESQERAAEIVVALDNLPLALDQAGAYIEETRCGLSRYLELYSKRRKELLLRRGRFPIDHPEPVATIWSLSFQRLEQESIAAADLLRLFAFLDPEAIPEEIIIQGAEELGPALGAIAHDPLEVDAIIELLLRYSLIRRIPEVNLLTIHRLVQAVLKDAMQKDVQHLWAERATRAVNRAFPSVELQTWEQCQRCLPHAYLCAIHSEEYELIFPSAARLFNEAASYLLKHAQYEHVEFLLRKALTIRQKVLDPNDPDIARTLNDLGVLYRSKGEYPLAKEYYEEALSFRKQVQGLDHLDVAQTLNNLGSLYRAQGAYAEAEPVYNDALRIRKKLLGDNHPLVAQSFYSLAKLYYSQANFQLAENFCLQALRIQEQQLGDNHSTIASTLSMLAKIYLGQNKLLQAKEISMHALQIRETTSGMNHPHVAIIINNMVEIYHAEKQYYKAQPLIARALKIHEQSLGPEHPYIAYSLTNLAENFFFQGDYIQAESHYKKALIIREQNLGYSHPHTASTYYDLARLYTTLERYEEAESLYDKALTIREHVLGPEHPVIADTLEQYAIVLGKLKKEKQAHELGEHARRIRARMNQD